MNLFGLKFVGEGEPHLLNKFPVSQKRCKNDFWGTIYYTLAYWQNKNNRYNYTVSQKTRHQTPDNLH